MLIFSSSFDFFFVVVVVAHKQIFKKERKKISYILPFLNNSFLPLDSSKETKKFFYFYAREKIISTKHYNLIKSRSLCEIFYNC